MLARSSVPPSLDDNRAEFDASGPRKWNAYALWFRDAAGDFAILLVSYLIATYLRRELPFGKYVGSNYEWHNANLYIAIAVGVIVAIVLRAAARPLHLSQSAQHFWAAIISIPCATLSLTILTPRQSGLEKAYFAISALILTLMVVPLPRSPEAEARRRTLLRSLTQLWANRALVRLWVQYNVQSRYAQAILGILWIVLLPLSTAFVMSIVFSEVMRIHIPTAPFIAFFLSGFVPWGLFSQGVSGSMRSLLGSLGLITQVHFPREIIILSALGEALVDSFFMFVAMLVINAIVGITPNGLYILLPVILLIQVSFTLGVMLIVSHLSVMIRDVPQLVSVLLQIIFYLCPIIYPITIVPQHYRFLVTLNPIAVLIEAYRNIILYNHVPDWSGLLYPAALAVAALIFGYRTFKANEDRFADMV